MTMWEAVEEMSSLAEQREISELNVSNDKKQVSLLVADKNENKWVNLLWLMRMRRNKQVCCSSGQ